MRVGLTGGIGSGKSTVAAMLSAEGATLIDTDAIAHSISRANGSAMPALAAAFGPGIIAADGGLDRGRMRQLVFANAQAKSRLEAILHPLIAAECARQAAVAPNGMVVFDVPLLVESGHWRALVERVLVVDAYEKTQIERVVNRSGWMPQAVRAVIQHQASRSARRAAADALIFNQDLSIANLNEEVRSLWRRWAPIGTR